MASIAGAQPAKSSHERVLPLTPALPLTERQFETFRNLTQKLAGIHIADYKKNMVYRRISKRLSALDMTDFDQYIAYLNGKDGDAEHQPFVNAMTTNKTGFFREPHHFQHLAAKALPLIVNTAKSAKGNRLRIWSAGCSSGAEPYSIAMTLVNSLPDLERWDAKILATDIDTDMIDYAKSGVYSDSEMEDVSAANRLRHFNQLDDVNWSASQGMRKLTVFNRLNLHDEWPMQGRFDIVFCRNVTIYFDKPSQQRLFDRFADIMTPHSFLYIGHSESLYRITDRFAPAGQSLYRKVV